MKDEIITIRVGKKHRGLKARLKKAAKDKKTTVSTMAGNILAKSCNP